MSAETRPTVAALGAVDMVPLTALKLAEDNPRRIPNRAVEVVALSLQRFGWQQPLVTRHGVLLAGHTRLLAARKLGLSEAPVVSADHLTEEEADAFRIADNRTHDFTTWDFPLLVDQLDALAPDFADVLALADWQSIVGDFDAASADAELDVPDEAAMLSTGFQLVVCFKSKAEALAAEPAIIDLPGAFDVRHKFDADK